MPKITHKKYYNSGVLKKFMDAYVGEFVAFTFTERGIKITKTFKCVSREGERLK